MTESLITGDAGGGRIRAMKVDYPGNSQRARQASPEKEPIQAVTTGEVKRRPKNFFHKASDAFFGESDGSVVDYIIFEVMIPAAKNMISDAISEGINKILFGDSKRTASRGDSRPGYTSYNTVRGSRPEPRMTTRQRAKHDFSDIIVRTRGEAEDVIEGLRNLISQFEVATVGDMYELASLTSDFTDDKWGWTDLRSASVRPVRDGYLIVLPKPQPLAT
jgi:hypothetical protein